MLVLVCLMCSFLHKIAKRKQTDAAGRCATAIGLRMPSEICRPLELIEDGVALSQLRQLAVSMPVLGVQVLLVWKQL